MMPSKSDLSEGWAFIKCIFPFLRDGIVDLLSRIINSIFHILLYAVKKATKSIHSGSIEIRSAKTFPEELGEIEFGFKSRKGVLDGLDIYRRRVGI